MSDTDTESNANDTAVAQKAVGELLRDTRAHAGLDIAEVARALRISQKYLEALEAGRDADLPGPTYAVGFVRSYAEHLGLDGGEIVRRYKAEAEGMAGRPSLSFPKPIPDSGVPGAAVLGLGVIVAAVAYGVWYWNSNADGVSVARVEPVPEEAAQPAAAPTPAEPAASEAASAPAGEAPATEQASAEQAATEPAPEPVASEPAAPESTVPAPAAEAASQPAATPAAAPAAQAAQDAASESEPEVAPAPTVAGAPDQSAPEAADEAVDAPQTPITVAPPAEAPAAEAPAEAAPAAQAATEAATEEAAAPAPVAGGPSRITVRATANSWIQIRDEAADRLLFTRLMREGDTYEVPGRSGLKLMTGNAGALELVVDGEAVPAIGASGEVRRNVELDPDKLKAGTAVAD